MNEWNCWRKGDHMKKGILQIGLQCTVLFLLFLIYGTHHVEAAAFPVKDRTIILPDSLLGDEKATHTGVIENLSNDDITLKGLIDGAELYYHVPVNGVEDGSYLQLNIQYSNLLLKGSTVTILVDEIPTFSTELDIQKDNMRIKVPLKGHAMTQGFHQVTISFYGHISEYHCANEENPANWLTLLSDSHLFLNQKEISSRKNALELYPYPFIQNNQDESVQSVIVIPDQPSVSILLSALKVANDLSRQASNEEIPIIRESSLEVISKHVIAIGNKDQWSGVVKELYTSANIKTPEKELVVSNYFLQFPQTTKQILFVTAESDKVIEEKISVVTEENFASQLTGNEVSIENVYTDEKLAKEKHSFEELNIPNLTLTGRKTMSQHYFYPLPSYVDIRKNSTLHLNLKVSNTLFTREEKVSNDKRAELVVYVNEEPHSIAIDDLEKDERMSTYRVDIPIESDVLQKSPFVMIQFEAKGLRNREICVPPDDDKWIFISEDSYLLMGFLETEAESNFRTWPTPFMTTDGTNETTILLPSEYDERMISQLQTLTNSIGNQGTLDGLQLLQENKVDKKKLKGRHVIILGGPHAHSALENKMDQLLIQTDKKKNLDVSAFKFINETSKYVAWQQSSIWDKDKSMAVFAAVHPNNTEQFLSKEIVDYLKTTALKATVVVQSKNGEIFTNELHESEMGNSQSKIDTGNSDKNTLLFILGFIGIFSLSLILFIYVYRKFKRNKKE